MKTKQWIDNFNSLESTQKLEVVDAIRDGLEEIMRSINEECNKSKQDFLRQFFHKFIKFCSEKEELCSIKESFKTFQTLSAERQERVVESIIDAIESCRREQEKEDKKNMCQEQGHIMTDWSYRTWTEKTEPGWIDRQWCEGFDCQREEWSRYCKRCGKVERTGEEPDELRIPREREEIKKKIKSLQDKLATLNNSL